MAKNGKNVKIEYNKLTLAKNPLTIVTKFSFLYVCGVLATPLACSMTFNSFMTEVPIT